MAAQRRTVLLCHSMPPVILQAVVHTHMSAPVDDERGDGNPGLDNEGNAHDPDQSKEGTSTQGAQAKSKRRGANNNASVSSTLADPETLVTAAPTATFENDPFFRRTSRMFDENTPTSECWLGSSRGVEVQGPW